MGTNGLSRRIEQIIDPSDDLIEFFKEEFARTGCQFISNRIVAEKLKRQLIETPGLGVISCKYGTNESPNELCLESIFKESMVPALFNIARMFSRLPIGNSRNAYTELVFDFNQRHHYNRSHERIEIATFKLNLSFNFQNLEEVVNVLCAALYNSFQKPALLADVKKGNYARAQPTSEGGWLLPMHQQPRKHGLPPVGILPVTQDGIPVKSTYVLTDQIMQDGIIYTDLFCSNDHEWNPDKYHVVLMIDGVISMSLKNDHDYKIYRNVDNVVTIAVKHTTEILTEVIPKVGDVITVYSY